MDIGILLAAGLGSRVKSSVPKQFKPLCGQPMLIRSLLCLTDVQELATIYIAVSEQWHEMATRMVAEAGIPDWQNRIHMVIGGTSRLDSLRNTFLAALSDGVVDDHSVMVVHDAARPFTTQKTMHLALDSARLYGASAAIVPVHDTLLNVHEQMIISILDRTNIYRGFSPAGANMRLWDECYLALTDVERSQITCTIQCMLMKGHQAFSFQDDDFNIKITTPWDIAVAETFLRQSEVVST